MLNLLPITEAIHLYGRGINPHAVLRVRHVVDFEASDIGDPTWKVTTSLSGTRCDEASPAIDFSRQWQGEGINPEQALLQVNLQVQEELKQFYAVRTEEVANLEAAMVVLVGEEPPLQELWRKDPQTPKAGGAPQ